MAEGARRIPPGGFIVPFSLLSSGRLRNEPNLTANHKAWLAGRPQGPARPSLVSAIHAAAFRRGNFRIVQREHDDDARGCLD
jgi:hypothetical protein